VSFAALVLLPCGYLSAQDATVTAPAWFNAENAAGDQLPTWKGRPKPEYPAEMRKSDEIGYALVGRTVDEKGKGGILFRRASHPYFLRSIETFESRLEPARSGGKPVRSFIWHAALFNPVGSKAKGPDATPRLLAAAPVFVSKQLIGDVDPDTLPPIWATITLDEKGDPQAVALENPATEKFLPAIQESLKQWQFAPARRDGQAISADLRFPFFVLPVMPARGSEKMVMPKPIRRFDPEYPLILRSNGLRGEVLTEFVVSDKGAVTEAKVVRSTDPAFDEPALEAIRRWKFEPGTQNGKPVHTRMQQPISFGIESARGGRDAYTVNNKKQNEDTPEMLRYDTPAKVRGVIVPVYPYELRRDEVKGKAAVAFVVNEAGAVSQVKVTEATHPGFGLALAAAVEQFSFDPALKDGKPTVSVLRFEQRFSRGTLEDNEGYRMLYAEKKRPESIFSAAALDAPLKPISRRAPVFPVSITDVSKGEAVVAIIVDEKGYVRLPRVVSASAPAFGYAAVQAISQWRFEPPKIKGNAVPVRVHAPFSFQTRDPGSKSPAAAEGPADAQ
jgi:TonB family protein